MVELVVTIVILGILAAIAIPRFVGRDTFASRGFFDQATETVRYAQKVSVAFRREVFVCVAGNSIRASLSSGCPDGQVLLHPGSGAPLTVAAPTGITVPDTLFSFSAPTAIQAGGQPQTGGVPGTVTIAFTSSVPGDPPRRIVIERETGYVHN